MIKQKKIDIAIREAKLTLEETEIEIMILSRLRDAQRKRIDNLETIRDDKNYE